MTQRKCLQLNFKCFISAFCMAGFFKSILQRFTKPDIDWEELEAMLISGDLGPKLALQIVTDLQAQQRKLHGADIVQVARDHVRKICPKRTQR